MPFTNSVMKSHEEAALTSDRNIARKAFYHGSAASACIAAAALLSSPAFAQSADASSRPNSAATADSAPVRPETGDIVVTAQRRSESLSKVPLSVSAFGAETLKTRVINREQDLASLVPGLIVKSGQNSNQISFTLRGQTLDPFSGASPAVLTYLNEAPYSGNNSATAFFDFSSVQVLKGPQGTLFGRNATGGAILYSSTMPGEVLGGYFTVRGGQRSLEQIQGAIDLPLIHDKLAVRVAGDFTRQDGYIHNDYTGNNLGDVNNKSIRVTVVARPSDGVKNVTLFQYSDFRGSETNGELYSYYKTGETNNGYALVATLDALYGHGAFPGVGNGPAAPGNYPGAVAGYLAYQQAHPYNVFLSYDLPHYSRNLFISNTTTFEVADHMTVKNIFSYGSSFSRTPAILSGSPFGSLDLYNRSGLGNGAPGGETFGNKRWSNELQLQGTAAGNQLKYILGGFFSKSVQTDYIPVIVGAEFPVPLADIAYYTKDTDISKAIFGQMTYNMSGALQGLSLTAGGRYTWESLSLLGLPGHLFPNVPEQRKQASAPSWTATIQYQFNPQNQVYFTTRGSWRSGNFNGTTVPFNNANSFANEYTHDFEVGYKYSGSVLGRSAHFNVALYDQSVKNAIRAVYALINGNPSGFAANAPKVSVKGVEVDADFMPLHSLKIGFAGAFTDAKYKNGLVDLSAATGIPNFLVSLDSYTDAPRWAGSLYVDYTLPTPTTWGPIHLRADGFRQSSTFFSSTNGTVTPRTQLPAYTTVQLRLSWDDILQSKVSAGIYAKNLFDKLYFQSGYVEGGSGGFNTAIPGEPRSIGAEVSVKF